MEGRHGMNTHPVYQFIELMESNPNDFYVDDYTLTHRPTNVSIWIGNGLSALKFYQPTKAELNRRERQDMLKAFNNWQRTLIHLKLKAVTL